MVNPVILILFVGVFSAVVSKSTHVSAWGIGAGFLGCIVLGSVQGVVIPPVLVRLGPGRAPCLVVVLLERRWRRGFVIVVVALVARRPVVSVPNCEPIRSPPSPFCSFLSSSDTPHCCPAASFAVRVVVMPLFPMFAYLTIRIGVGDLHIRGIAAFLFFFLCTSRCAGVGACLLG